MHGIGQHLQKTKLILAVVAILILSSVAVTVSCAPQSEQGKDHEDNNVVVFSNPPESQRFKGDYGPSFAAQQVIELDHYLMGYKGESPRLYIEYTNISNETVKIDIGIMWLVARNDIVRQVGQYDIRPPISPGQSERLTYRPIVESPSEIVNYYIEVHSLLDEQLPHVAFGPQVGPEEATTPPAPSIKHQIALSHDVAPRFSVDSTAGLLPLPVVVDEDLRFAFPLVVDYVSSSQWVILPITLEVTDPTGISVPDAQIFMGKGTKLGTTDKDGKFVYGITLSMPSIPKEVATLSFSAKKNESYVTAKVPIYLATVLEMRSTLVDEETYEMIEEALYLYHLGKPSFPLPSQLKFLQPFLPLLKTIGDLKEVDLQIGDSLTRKLIEYRVPDKEPSAWVYYEEIKRNDKVISSSAWWTISERDMQRIQETYFFGEPA